MNAVATAISSYHGELECYVPAADRWVGGRPASARRPAPAVLRQRRLAALVMFVTASIGLGAAAHLVLAGSGGAPASAPGSRQGVPTAAVAAGHATYLVQPGDSLWVVARRVAAGGDVRAMVDRLVALNGRQALRPGQRLLLP